MAWATGQQASRYMQNLAAQAQAGAAKESARARAAEVKKAPSKDFKNIVSAANAVSNVAKTASDVYTSLYMAPYYDALTSAQRQRVETQAKTSQFQALQGYNEFLEAMDKNAPPGETRGAKARRIRAHIQFSISEAERRLQNPELEEWERKSIKREIRNWQTFFRMEGSEGWEYAKKFGGLSDEQVEAMQGRGESPLTANLQGSKLGRQLYTAEVHDTAVKAYIAQRKADVVEMGGGKNTRAYMALKGFEEQLGKADFQELMRDPKNRHYVYGILGRMAAKDSEDAVKFEWKRPDGTLYDPNTTGQADFENFLNDSLNNATWGAVEGTVKAAGVSEQEYANWKGLLEDVETSKFMGPGFSAPQALLDISSRTKEGLALKRQVQGLSKLMAAGAKTPGDMRTVHAWYAGAEEGDTRGAVDINQVQSLILSGGHREQRGIARDFYADNLGSSQYLVSRLVSGDQADPTPGMPAGIENEHGKLMDVNEILHYRNDEGEFHPSQVKGFKDLLGNLGLAGFKLYGAEVDNILPLMARNTDANRDDWADIARGIEAMIDDGAFGWERRENETAAKIAHGMRMYAAGTGSFSDAGLTTDDFKWIANDYIKVNALTYEMANGEVQDNAQTGESDHHPFGRGHGWGDTWDMKAIAYDPAEGVKGANIMDTSTGKVVHTPARHVNALNVHAVTMTAGWANPGFGYEDLKIPDLSPDELEAWDKNHPEGRKWADVQEMLSNPGQVLVSKGYGPDAAPDEEVAREEYQALDEEFADRFHYPEKYMEKDINVTTPEVYGPREQVMPNDAANRIHNPDNLPLTEDADGMPIFKTVDDAMGSLFPEGMPGSPEASPDGITAAEWKRQHPEAVEEAEGIPAAEWKRRHEGIPAAEWKRQHPEAVEEAEGVPAAEWKKRHPEATAAAEARFDIERAVDDISSKPAPDSGYLLQGLLKGLTPEGATEAKEPDPGGSALIIQGSVNRLKRLVTEGGGFNSPEAARLIEFLSTVDPETEVSVDGRMMKVGEMVDRMHNHPSVNFHRMDTPGPRAAY